MAKKMTFSYDEEGDVLYAFYGNPVTSIYEAVGRGVYLRRDPHTDEIIGFMVLNYASRSRVGKLPSIPHFEKSEIPPLEEMSVG